MMWAWHLHLEPKLSVLTYLLKFVEWILMKFAKWVWLVLCEVVSRTVSFSILTYKWAIIRIVMCVN